MIYLKKIFFAVLVLNLASLLLWGCGDDAETPSCENVANPCSAAGTSCNGDILVGCAADADGCLVESQTDCAADNKVCSADPAPAACVDDVDPCQGLSLCDTPGTSCSGNNLITCAADANGCLVESQTDCTADNKVCSDDPAPAACVEDDLCAGLTLCDVEGVSCDGNNLLTCAMDDNSCLVETSQDCTLLENGYCNDTLVPPACDTAEDPCATVENPCDAILTECVGDTLVVCAEDGNGCLFETQTDCTANDMICEIDACVPPSPGQIAVVRQAIDDALELPLAGSWDIEGALVTFVKPEIGGDAAGFFIQNEQTGPALFVLYADAPTTPDVGDEVTLNITELDSMNDIHVATQLGAAPTVTSSLNDVSFLIQDVSDVDLVTNMNDYVSELIVLSGTFSGPFSHAGTGFVAAQINTSVIVDDPSLRLRVPDTLGTTLEATYQSVVGCDVTMTAAVPLWRYYATAQPSAFEESGLDISCPAPQLLSAGSISTTEVQLTFSRPIDALSITDPSIQFMIDPSLAVLAADVDGVNVTLVTEAQTADLEYTVTVAETVTDGLGSGVDPNANQANFFGFTAPQLLLINEVELRY
jgi:hypothetical protein